MLQRVKRSTSLPALVALEDAGKTTMSTAIEAFVSGASEGALDIGSATPFVGPVFVVLKEAYALVQTANANKDDLQELTGLCHKIAVNVVGQHTWDVRVAPTGLQDLRALVEEVRDLAMHYNGRKFWVRLLGSRKDRSEFERLRTRINELIPVLGLSVTLRSTKAFSDQMEELRQTMISTVHAESVDIRQAAEMHRKELDILSCVASAIDVTLDAMEVNTEEILMLLRGIASQSNPAMPKRLAAKPKGLPITGHWHLERKDKAGRVIDALSVVQSGMTSSARAVGLLGPGGAGKTTVAAAVARSEEIRARFSDGVLWIPVGEGTKDRLDTFVFRLAKMVYDHVAHRTGRPPPDSPFQYPELGASYVRKKVNERDHPLRCLLVADNVWEREVVDLLRQTGLWVLVTTRKRGVMDETTEAVVDVEGMSEIDAERLLRLAAELDEDEPLPDAAYDLMERCDYLAMDLAFVGRWSDVRRRSDQQAWKSVLDSILRQDEEIQKENASRQTHVEIEQNTCRATERRHAILRAGFEDLQNKRHRRLYMSLAVFPKGFTFSAGEIAVLLYDRDDPGGTGAGTAAETRVEEEAKALAESLEGWAVLGRHRDNLYSLHDTHADFVKHSIANFPELRRQCVSRWCGHLSTLEVVRSCDWYTLQGLFRAVEPLREDGDGRVTRAYDAALAAQDDGDPHRLETLRAVSFFYLMEGDYEAVNDLWRVNLEQFEAKQGQSHPAVGYCLMELGIASIMAGNIAEAHGLLSRALDIFEKAAEVDPLQLAQALHAQGRCVLIRGEVKDAEGLYNRALRIRQEHLGPDHPMVARTLNGLGRCAMESGNTANARDLLERALCIEEASLRRDHPDISWTLHDLGSCKVKMGEVTEAAEILRRVLHVREATLGKDHPDVAYTLLELGRCAVKRFVTEEAEELFNRALDIRVKKLGDEHPHVAVVLNELGECALMDDGRVEEAEEFFQKSYDILRASKAPQYDIKAMLRSLHEAKRRQRSSSTPAKWMTLFSALVALIVVALSLATFLWLGGVTRWRCSKVADDKTLGEVRI